MEYEEAVVIDEEAEALFIQNYLIEQGSGIISVDDIKFIIEAQSEFLISIGLAERNEE